MLTGSPTFREATTVLFKAVTVVHVPGRYVLSMTDNSPIAALYNLMPLG